MARGGSWRRRNAELAHPEQGVDSSLKYTREGGGIVPHVTLKSIAQDLPPDEEILYDRPDVNRRKARVSGPFTVEAIPMAAIDESTNFILSLIESLRKDGLTRVGGGSLRFTKLNPIPSGGVLRAEGELDLGDGQNKLSAVSFGPRYGPVTMTQVEEAIQQARGRYDGLVVLGFTFDGPAQEFLKRDLPVQVMGAYINNDVLWATSWRRPRGASSSPCSARPTSPSRRPTTATSWRCAALTSTTPRRARWRAPASPRSPPGS